MSQALIEVESNPDIKATLREVFFTGAKELDAAGKKAICIFVPVPQQKTFQKIQVSNTCQLINAPWLCVLCFMYLQPRLVRELEKKFSGRPVVFIAQRRILPKPKRNQRTKQKQLRPRRWVEGKKKNRQHVTIHGIDCVLLSFCSRTLTAVHDAILEDLVYPAEIVGKRIRVKLDGSRLIKV